MCDVCYGHVVEVFCGSSTPQHFWLTDCGEAKFVCFNCQVGLKAGLSRDLGKPLS
jgi:hypothetical protein